MYDGLEFSFNIVRAENYMQLGLGVIFKIILNIYL